MLMLWLNLHDNNDRSRCLVPRRLHEITTTIVALSALYEQAQCVWSFLSLKACNPFLLSPISCNTCDCNDHVHHICQKKVGNMTVMSPQSISLAAADVALAASALTLPFHSLVQGDLQPHEMPLLVQ